MNSKSSFRTNPVRVQIAVISFAIAGLLVTLGSIVSGDRWSVAQSLGLIALSIATARTNVRLTETSSISLLTSTVLLALLMGGTGLAVITGICGVITQNVFPSRKIVIHQLAFNAGMIALTVGAAGGVFQLLVRPAATGFAEQFLAAIIASLIYFFCNSSSIALIIGLSKGMSVVDVWRKHMVSTAPSFVIAGMLALALFWMVLSPSAGIVIAAVPMVGSVYYVSLWLARQPLQGLQQGKAR
jgi:hypothetical protein